MGWWDKVRRTGQREAHAYLVTELPEPGAGPLTPGSDYFRVWLCEMFLAQRSTLLAQWLPPPSVAVSPPSAGRPPVQFTRMLRPQLTETTGGVVLLNYPITDLVPYAAGGLEVDAALFGLQTGNRLDIVVDLLQTVSSLPIPALGPAVAVAQQVATGARDLVADTDGQVHLDLHQGWASAPDEARGQFVPGQSSDGPGLRATYLAAL